MPDLPEDANKSAAGISRRELLTTSLGVAALGAAPAAVNANNLQRGVNTEAPFDSMRDYIAALDKQGLVVRIPKVDQDAYEAAALMYRMRDQHGMRGAPTLFFDELRINGKWVKGPLIVNESGHMDGECIAFGLTPVSEAPLHRPPFDSYRKARRHVEKRLADNNGLYPLIDPVEVPESDAACKEIILRGDEIDLTKFQFIQGNPADAGRYINTGSVFTRHPKYGVNFGTYRCHLRGPREIGLNSEPGQTGHRHLSAAKARGEKIARVSIALTTDPYVWMVSGSKMNIGFGGPVDELAIAGGLAGRPTQVVKSETNDLMVPAWAEMIIEGEVPLDDTRSEGPYGEWFGYQGPIKEKVFWMRVTAVTHRRDPWIMNNFTGVQAGALMAASHAGSIYRLRQQFPYITDWFYDTRSSGFTVVSIDKSKPGQGMEVANYIAEKNFTVKVVVVVDSDVDVTDQEQVLKAMVARWQPHGNTKLYESMPILPLDQSAPRTGRGSKIAIDATRALPGEGRNRPWPAMNRTLLEEGAPNAFDLTDNKWGRQIRDWRKNG